MSATQQALLSALVILFLVQISLAEKDATVGARQDGDYIINDDFFWGKELPAKGAKLTKKDVYTGDGKSTITAIEVTNMSDCVTYAITGGGPGSVFCTFEVDTDTSCGHDIKVKVYGKMM